MNLSNSASKITEEESVVKLKRIKIFLKKSFKILNDEMEEEKKLEMKEG